MTQKISNERQHPGDITETPASKHAIRNDSELGECPACSAPFAGASTLSCEARGKYFGYEVTFRHCHTCGFAFAPTNSHDYRSEDDFGTTSRPRSRNRRVGTDKRPGREFWMATLGCDILRRSGAEPKSMLFFGPGLSRDHVHAARNFPGVRVQICDLGNFQQTENFLPIDSTERFDVVIVCEVAEHFTDPRRDFQLLLSKLSDQGIAVISTNISAGEDLRSQSYPFVPGHTAYYSGRSLQALVQRFDPGLHVDFRPPHAALAQLGPHKRYALVHRARTWPGIAEYFSSHLMAPSEPAYFRLGIVRSWNWLKRRLKTARRP